MQRRESGKYLHERQAIIGNEGAVLIDVRETEEFPKSTQRVPFISVAEPSR